MTRDEQIERLEGASERNRLTAASWRDNAAVRAATAANIEVVRRISAQCDKERAVRAAR